MQPRSTLDLISPGAVPTRRYQHVFLLDKLAYNTMHPFTSWMPILCWIVVRPPPVLRLWVIVFAHSSLE